MGHEIDLSFKDLKGKDFRFSNVNQLKDFALQEATYWREKWSEISGFGERNQHPYISVYSNWQSVYEHLEGLRSDFEKWDQEAVNANILGQYQGWVRPINKRWIWSGQPFNEAWIQSYKLSQETGDAFINTIVSNSVNGVGSFNSLKGVVLAYEFDLQDESSLTKRRYSEEKSLSRLRGQLTEKKDELVKQVEDFQKSMSAWVDGTQNDFNEWHQEKKDEFSVWYRKQDESLSQAEIARATLFNNMLDGWKTDIGSLEHTYQEKLRLAAPATYWHKRAKSLSFQGGLWAALLVLSSVILTIGAGIFFWSWLHKDPVPFGPQSLQGVALFGATAAAAVFLIKILSRLTFSAFHLQRDAEEKEQLTHLYLSLVHEGAIDIKSRDIVLQALFSRAETGLLAGESSPTMPGLDGLAGLARSVGQK